MPDQCEIRNRIHGFIRDALETDLPALVAIKGKGSEALHLDRMRDARDRGIRYLVLLVGSEIIGFACLVFRRPKPWPDTADMENLPQIVDLQISETWRGQGYGTDFINGIKQITAEAGHRQLFLSVEPIDNTRAYSLYQRLGFNQLQPEPYPVSWKFTDSSGKVHQGEEWVVDMMINL